MADYEVRRRASIGTSSLILIFIVLCLATFGMLSLGNARREERFSQKNAQAVQEYYRADGQGELFVQQMDQALLAAAGEADLQQRKRRVLAEVGAYYREDEQVLRTDIPMEAGLALRVEIAVDWETQTGRVITWNVYDREAYEIDQSVPVWTGA